MHDPTTRNDAGGRTVSVVERLLTPQEIAEAWQLDASTVRRIFQDMPGVFKLESGGRKKRAYVTLRIPLTVVERVFQERSR
jgi:hypothetical protein